MIDERLRLRTPEGAQLTLVPAGIMPRLVAFAIDMAIRIAIYIAAAIVLGLFKSISGGLMLILIFLLEWFYPVLFELFMHGQTPGKRTMGLAVVHSDGSPVTANGSIVRNLLRTADMFPVFYLAGFLSMLVSQRFQRLGDLAADTLVIHLDQGRRPETSVHVPERAPDWPVDVQDQQTLVAFLERGQALTPERRQELARIVYPELPDQDAERQALGVARHLLGDT
ncbi:MAG: RDD family protein [Alcanivoracaceae bacterium]